MSKSTWKRKGLFRLMISESSAHGLWCHCFDPEARQNMVMAGVCGRVSPSKEEA
jgi:hypothetical protein